MYMFQPKDSLINQPNSVHQTLTPEILPMNLVRVSYNKGDKYSNESCDYCLSYFPCTTIYLSLTLHLHSFLPSITRSLVLKYLAKKEGGR